MGDVTRLLEAIGQGDALASGRLVPLVYDELRTLARRKLARESPGHTLNATALVHEAYLRLVGNDVDGKWDSRGHFFAAASEAMRRILVENARRKLSLKRGGDRAREDVEVDAIAVPKPDEDLIALDEALSKFEARDPIKASLVKLRYFSGMTIPQAAEVLGISSTTADRYWSYARAWLKVEISKNSGKSMG